MASKNFHAEKFLWIDLEMTGLDPEKETILEFGAIVTNPSLQIIEVGPDIVIRHDASAFAAMDSWNRKHHKKSGLWSKALSSTVTLSEAEATIVKFMERHFNTNEKAILAGNSIWQDRRFIVKYMPKVHDLLHYRMIDVSSIKLLTQAWYPQLEIPKKRDQHRAVEDIEDSIAELAFYRKSVFLP